MLSPTVPRLPLLLMATRSYTITSHYSPPLSPSALTPEEEPPLSDEEPHDLNNDAGYIDPDELEAAEQEAIWRTGPTYKSRSAAVDSDVYVSHRAAFPPQFVPATLTQDDYLSTTTAPSHTESRVESESVSSQLGSWYKSLRSTTIGDPEEQVAGNIPAQNGLAGPSSAPAVSPPIHPQSSHTIHANTLKLSHQIPSQPSFVSQSRSSSSRKRKHTSDWFIRSALSNSNPTTASDTGSAKPSGLNLTPQTSIPQPPSSSTPQPQLSASSSSTSITDILLRNPPPPPGASTQSKVRTKIGPGNIGYGLLTKSGWKEGEGLGRWRIEAGGDGGVGVEKEEENSLDEDAKMKELLLDEKKCKGKKHVIELDEEGRQIVDLTLDSDSDPDLYEDVEEGDDLDAIPRSTLPADDFHGASSRELLIRDSAQADGRTVLLKPIDTFLKSDRLGIGASHRDTRPRPSTATNTTSRGDVNRKIKKKPLTDTSQAFHTRHELAEQRRRRRMDELREGGKSQRKRGAKGFKRAREDEDGRRKDMLGYMNS